jgi:hypothetical protein
VARRSPYQNLNKIILILAETKRDGVGIPGMELILLLFFFRALKVLSSEMDPAEIRLIR